MPSTASLDFDGVNDYVDVADHSDLDNTGSFTYEAWVLDEHTTGNWNHGRAHIMGNGGYDSSTGGATLAINFRVLTLYYKANSTRITVGGPNVSNTGLDITWGAWHHFAVTYDSSTKVYKFYVNGNLESTSSAQAANVLENDINFIVGANRGNNTTNVNGYWNGKIDEVRFWNVCRTDSEIADYYNKKASGTESGLVLCWHIDEGSGLSTGDAAGTAQNGTISGATWDTSNFPTLTDAGGGNSTFTLSGGPTLEPPSVAGTISHSRPIYTVVGGTTIEPPSVSGSLTSPYLSGTISGNITIDSSTVSGTLSNTRPTYTLVGTVSVEPPTVAATIAVTLPTYTTTGSVTVPAPTVSGSLQHTQPISTISGSPTVGSPTVIGALAFATTASVISGAPTVGSPTVAGTLANTRPTYTFVGTVDSGSPSVSGTLAHTKPTYTATGNVSSGAPSISGSLSAAASVAQITGTVVSGQPIVSGSLSHTTLSHTLSGTVSAGSPSVIGSLDFDPPATLSGAVSAGSPVVSGALSTANPTYVVSGVVSVSPAINGTVTVSNPTSTIIGSVTVGAPTVTGNLSWSELAPAPTIVTPVTMRVHNSKTRVRVHVSSTKVR